nr:MAG TPA: hypothetical protein [Caudoviricetes sp.]
MRHCIRTPYPVVNLKVLRAVCLIRFTLCFLGGMLPSALSSSLERLES